MFFFSPSPETKNQRDYSEASCLSLSTTFVVLFHSVLAYATRSTQHNNRSGNSTTFSLSSLINIASLLFAIKKDETRFCIRGNIHLLGGRKDGIYIYSISSTRPPTSSVPFLLPLVDWALRLLVWWPLVSLIHKPVQFYNWKTFQSIIPQTTTNGSKDTLFGHELYFLALLIMDVSLTEYVEGYGCIWNCTEGQRN